MTVSSTGVCESTMNKNDESEIFFFKKKKSINGMEIKSDEIVVMEEYWE